MSQHLSRTDECTCENCGTNRDSDTATYREVVFAHLHYGVHPCEEGPMILINPLAIGTCLVQARPK